MIFWSYVILTLKQLVRMKVAFFFTLLFPILLYFFYGHDDQPESLIIFANFLMQSAMLQSVGMFITVHTHSTWGEYLSTLPVQRFYPIFGTIIAMFLTGLCGLILICLVNLFYVDFSLTNTFLLIIGVSIGSIPLGALGYLIGISFDQMSARNILLFTNLFFLFVSFVPKPLQLILSYFLLPNSWLEFSRSLVLEKKFNTYSFFILIAYFLVFNFLIIAASQPKKKYMI